MTLEIAFWGGWKDWPKQPLTKMTDDEIEKARVECEKTHGPLPIDERTGYPSFGIYEDGEEIGGG